MALTEIGTFPASAINFGLADAAAGLALEVEKLGVQVGEITATGLVQIDWNTNQPFNLPAYAVQFTASLDPASLIAAFNPANWVSLTADVSVDLLARLGVVEGWLGIMAALMLNLEAGASAGSLAGWTYAGDARGFGIELERATLNGFGGVDPATEVSALIVGTALHASWVAFGEGVNVGDSAAEDLGETTTERRLKSLGVLNGGQWSTGVSETLARLRLFTKELEGLRAALLAQLDVAAGLNLPDPTDLVDFGLTIDLDAALASMATIQTDLDAQIGGLELTIDTLADLIARIGLVLSVGGLTLWSFTGPAGSLGATFRPAVDGGLPNVDAPSGSTYGLVIATQSPGAWVDFGKIFLTG